MFTNTSMNTYNKKVLLGMSGGVDSTAAAVILQQKGYEVIGVTFVQTSFEEMEPAIADAKKAASVLGIEHYVLDLRNEFQEEIIKYFHSEYDRGRTPNPCVKCNQVVKYKKFLEEADRLGAHYISSGQYAKIVLEDGRYIIKKAENKYKDQSYYLYNLKEKDLERILMPLGDIRDKEEARQIVKDIDLDFSQKKDSQEICFISDNDHVGFLEEYINPQKKLGNFVDTKGRILGKHKGIHKYTVGQRKGLGIALGSPRYVVKIDTVDNNVILGVEQDLYEDTCTLEDYNIVFDDYDIEKEAFDVQDKIFRKETEATVKEGHRLIVTFTEPVKALAPGQSLVIYDGDILIGGGIIDIDM